MDTKDKEPSQPPYPKGAKPAAECLCCIENVSRTFTGNGARVEVLTDACLEIHPGETIAVVGASGIGKSTLLHVLGTLDRPDSGTYTFRSENVFAYDDTKLADFRNTNIGFVFQFHHLLPEFTALENTMMPALINGMAKSRARQMATAFLSRVDLDHRLNHRVSDLSGGEQQRVALARALVMKPVLLLADEPTGNLDKRNSKQVHDMLMTLNRELGMTMVVVTHNLELAALMQRRITITDGMLVQIDD